jgi:uncharacterized protein YjiS (DUF1127 family)
MYQTVITISDWLNFSGILDYFRSIKTNLKRASLAKQTYTELNKLSDAELKDIGIHRGNIRAISNEIFYDNYPVNNSNKNLNGWV